MLRPYGSPKRRTKLGRMALLHGCLAAVGACGAWNPPAELTHHTDGISHSYLYCAGAEQPCAAHGNQTLVEPGPDVYFIYDSEQTFAIRVPRRYDGEYPVIELGNDLIPGLAEPDPGQFSLSVAVHDPEGGEQVCYVGTMAALYPLRSPSLRYDLLGGPGTLSFVSDDDDGVRISAGTGTTSKPLQDYCGSYEKDAIGAASYVELVVSAPDGGFVQVAPSVRGQAVAIRLGQSKTRRPVSTSEVWDAARNKMYTVDPGTVCLERLSWGWLANGRWGQLPHAACPQQWASESIYGADGAALVYPAQAVTLLLPDMWFRDVEVVAPSLTPGHEVRLISDNAAAAGVRPETNPETVIVASAKQVEASTKQNDQDTELTVQIVKPGNRWIYAFATPKSGGGLKVELVAVHAQPDTTP